MSETCKPSIRIPTQDELQSVVVPRHSCAAAPPPHKVAGKARTTPEDAACVDRILSLDAGRFLRHAAELHHRSMTLEERWAALSISSGSRKERILDELRRHGYIRLERKGRSYQVHLYGKAYDLLELPRPKGEGVGGTTHHFLVTRIAAFLKKRGYEVHIEREVGPAGKRVDLVAYGKDRIIGAEVGLSDVRQELKNLRDDLDSGVLDLLLFVSTDIRMVEKVRDFVEKDVYLSKHRHRIRFYNIKEISE
jgi:hypothetical protein